MKEILIDGLHEIRKDFKEGDYKKQIANILTMSRLISPFVLIPLAYFNKILFCVIMVAIFSLTDLFDGYFARKYNAVSKFGKYLDCLVDKVYALSLLISFVFFPWVSKYLMVYLLIIIALEILIAILNLSSYFQNLQPFSTKIGKIKTGFLFISFLLLYLTNLISIPKNLIIILLVLTILLQIDALLSYIVQRKKNNSRSSLS